MDKLKKEDATKEEKAKGKLQKATTKQKENQEKQMREEILIQCRGGHFWIVINGAPTTLSCLVPRLISSTSLNTEVSPLSKS
jgi:hypothetical protein